MKVGTKVIFTEHTIFRCSRKEQDKVNKALDKNTIELDTVYMVSDVIDGVYGRIKLFGIKGDFSHRALRKVVSNEISDRNLKVYKVPSKKYKEKVEKEEQEKVEKEEQEKVVKEAKCHFGNEKKEKFYQHIKSHGEVKTTKSVENVLECKYSEYANHKAEVIEYLKTRAKQDNLRFAVARGVIMIKSQPVDVAPSETKEIITDDKVRISSLEAQLSEMKRLAKEDNKTIKQLNKDLEIANKTATAMENISKERQKKINSLEEENKRLKEERDECYFEEDKDVAQSVTGVISAYDRVLKKGLDFYKSLADSLKDHYIESTDPVEKRVLAAIINEADVDATFEWSVKNEKK